MVDVVPTLQALRPRDVSGRVAVVIDVLRATSTLVTALAAGAREVRPAATPREARVRYDRLAAARGGTEGLLLGGERMGLRIEGFDLGNSPLEYTPERVSGKTIFFTTTNGTRTLRRAAGTRTGGGGARRVLVAAFLNATAVAKEVLSAEGDVVLCCAGTRGGFSLEDILLAGFIAAHLERNAPFVFRDLARAAAALYRSMAGEDGRDLARAVAAADHARHLTALGFGDDIVLCATLDTTDIVPEYRRGRVVVP